MADYWKSQPKKFCQYCKCWIADNKPSIEFHERGKNHKENVAAKIAEIKKKSIDKAKLEERMSREFAVMEEAALKAFQEDLKRLEAESGAVEAQSNKQTAQPVAANTKSSDCWLQGVTDDGLFYYYNTRTGESQWDKPQGFKEGIKSLPEKEVVTQIPSDSLWVEALSPDGYTYYYNTETGESSWEKPSKYCPQSEGSSSEDSETQQDPVPPQPEPLSEEESSSKLSSLIVDPEKSKEPKVPKISFRRKKEEKSEPCAEEKGEDRDKDNSASSYDDDDDDGDGNEDSSSQPVPLTEEPTAKKPRKTNPYGEWEQIQEEEDPYGQVDLQLPQAECASTTAGATEAPPEPKVKFMERTITSLGDESDRGEVFRKRKLDNGKSRSLRQRGKDD